MPFAKYLTEFLGTFFLVFFIGLVSVSGDAETVVYGPLAVGLGLVMLVYMGGHISMAHYNPAVTIAFAVRGDCKPRDIVPYWIAQFLGGLLAPLLITLIVSGDDGQNLFGPMPGEGQGMFTIGPWIIEILFTFILMLVILNVAVYPTTKGNQYYGLAIGLTVTAIAYTGGGISGGAYNPAVGFGPNIVKYFMSGDAAALQIMPLYFVAPAIGALMAVPVFKIQLLDMTAESDSQQDDADKKSA